MSIHQAPPAASRPMYAAPMATSHAPAGTFSPGTKVQVGSHRVVIEKYLSEGGFAHVYVVRLSGASNETAVLKRVAVPDKDALASMRTEVDTMKKLKGHKHIVMYIDSHASQLKGGGYEVFLLMEYCAGGGLIDFMNTRLKNRLTEPEILEIVSDAAEGVACMHYLKPPLLHRDLKVENILISKTSTSKRYKLCDFGSTAPPRPAATNATEGRLIEEDVQKNTTLQYRSPEMIDVYRHRPIDEKSDIWALGVFLYKLCYYTTPFEEQGQMAILSASFKYPASPSFSDRLKRLIAMMLMEDPRKRPNIYQVIKEVCRLRGKDVPIKDIYAGRTQSEARNTQELPSKEPNVKSPPLAGATVAVPEQVKQYIPEVMPMRRGRPTAPGQQTTSGQPSPSPAKKSGDPFAALDSKNFDERVEAVNELSSKFPSIDQFSLLQDKDKFRFATTSSQPASKPAVTNQRVTNALADDAFAKPSPANTRPTSAQPNEKAGNDRVAPTRPYKPQSTPSNSTANKSLEQPRPLPKPSAMVSTGTMTSQPPSPKELKLPKLDDRPVWRVPQRTESPRLAALTRFDSLVARSPNLRNASPPTSELPELQMIMSPASSRPSLEGVRPSSIDLGDPMHRSRSANARPSGQSPPRTESNSRKRESFFRWHSSKRNSKNLTSEALQAEPQHNDDSKIASDLEFLRIREEEEAAATARNGHRRSSSKQSKHASLPSLSGTKQMLAGKFGDTFRKFEPSRSSNSRAHQSPDDLLDLNSPEHAASTSTNHQLDDPVLADEEAIDETEDLSPAMRRELERLELEKEERRVEEAAQAYRARLATNRNGNVPPPRQSSVRASAIQNRVKNLLDESGRTSPVKKTAEGYGRYTTPSSAPSPPPKSATASRKTSMPPTTMSSGAALDPPRQSSLQKSASISVPQSTASSGKVPPQPQAQKPLPNRPSAPPKPVALRTGGSGRGGGSNAPSPALPRGAFDGTGETNADSPDWEAKFSERYPRVSLELVEEDLGAGSGDVGPIGGDRRNGERPLRVRNV